jgi:hypothetical protein
MAHAASNRLPSAIQVGVVALRHDSGGGRGGRQDSDGTGRQARSQRIAP